MKEIKFRGKRVDNGEWVYGYYFEGFTGIPYILVLHDHILGMTEFYEVNPSTVGQYIGLKDKSDKEIYENDILSIECYSYEEPEDEVLGTVTTTVFGNALIVTRDSGETECLYLSGFRGSYTTIYEVIGNIHDNPELIKAGA